MDKMKRDKAGKYSDRNQVSEERYERKYAKKAAWNILKKLDANNEPGDKVTIQARTLYRLCQVIVKA